ncbi:hypothetical protein GGQ92_000718 [Gracilibacillus halotolerans]|uniref:Uncharacterized protein n=1 Tax=Gracilibacillus halotolerans TaxID=74386 RepID=A0A841RH28_9BACI|nr:hypothetical protein [Gracilibacillus halotolerans]MBB6511951.1 hypothetical protein [Gracilibacillus halotolerans]
MAETIRKELNWMGNTLNKGEWIKNCNKLILRRDIWILAYEQVYQKQVTESDVQKMDVIISKLANMFQQLQRKNYIMYLNNTIFENRLLIEVVRIILMKIYEHYLKEYPIMKNEMEMIHYIKRTRKKVTWLCAGELNLQSSQINKRFIYQLRRNVKDELFILLVDRICKRAVDNKNKSNQALRSIYHLLVDISLIEWDALMSVSPHEVSSANFHPRYVSPTFYVRYKQHFICGYTSSKRMAKKHLEAMQYLKKWKFEHSGVYHWQTTLPFLDYTLRFNDKQNSSVLLSKSTVNRLITTYANLPSLSIKHRPQLINKTELEIIQVYNKELTSMAEKFFFIDNFYVFDKIRYFAKSSLIKTIACKRRSTSKKVTISLKNNEHQTLGVFYEKNGSRCWYGFITYRELRTIQFNKRKVKKTN